MITALYWVIQSLTLELGNPDAASVMVAMPLVVWFRPVIRHDGVGVAGRADHSGPAAQVEQVTARATVWVHAGAV